MAQIIDGKQLAASIKEKLARDVIELQAQYGRVPSLVVILVGDNPASQSYVKGKIKAAEVVGINSQLLTFPADLSEEALLSEIDRLNNDDAVDGILVQLPLPKHISEDKVISAIAAEKDVDGFHPTNVAKLWLGEKCLLPCTPKGIMRMIELTGIQTSGATAVVIGRSNIVGKPIAKLLLDANATVVMTHSRTKNMTEITRQADILVVAIGKPNFVTAEYLKPGAVVIDVGINRKDDGKLCGDVDFEAAKDIAGWLTPVPGGVGPMTIAMLMENTVECFINRIKN